MVYNYSDMKVFLDTNIFMEFFEQRKILIDATRVAALVVFFARSKCN